MINNKIKQQTKRHWNILHKVEKTVKMTTIFRFKMTTIFGAK